MTEREYFGDWLGLFDVKAFHKTLDIIGSMYDTKSVEPSMSEVFKVFRLCVPQDCRVVMLGQDPYPQRNIATGIAFGNRPDTPEDKWSPSLRVLRNSAVDLEVPHNLITFDPSLESWVTQGVLTLNSSLTVETGRPGSHTMLWRPFVSNLLHSLSRYNPDIVFVLLGDVADTFSPYIDRRCVILRERHPSWYARVGKDMPHRLFSDIDAVLRFRYGDTIKWYNEESVCQS